MNFFCSILVCVLVFVSCQPNAKQREIQATILQWREKRLIIPQPDVINWNEADTCNMFLTCRYKIVYYIDGDCHDCIEKLPKIDSIYHQIRTTNTVLLLYVYSSDYDHFEKALGRNKRLKIPFLYDKENRFYIENKLSPDPLFHCFLLDENNKIMVAGSFVVSRQMTELYATLLRQDQ